MKHKRKIRGKAIALRCIDDGGYYLINKGQIYLGIPSSNHDLFEIFIPKFNFKNPHTTRKFHTAPYPKSYFEPINPSHKYNPIFF